MTAAVADTRKERNRQQLTLLAGWCGTVLAAPALVALVVVAALARSLLLGLLAGVVVYVAVTLVGYRHVRGFGGALVAALPTTEVDEPARARLDNLVDGLCIAHGVTRPRIRVLGVGCRNAATVVLGDAEREVVLLITADVVTGLSRIELEGVLAQQLSHVRDGDAALSSFVAAVASVPVAGPLLARRAGACLGSHLESDADLAAAAMTRYPPGLASALGRIGDGSTAVPGVSPIAAHLWIADPLPEGVAEPFAPHPPLVDRIEVLGEL